MLKFASSQASRQARGNFGNENGNETECYGNENGNENPELETARGNLQNLMEMKMEMKSNVVLHLKI